MNTGASVILNISIFTVFGMIVISSIIYWFEREKRQLQVLEFWIANGSYYLAASLLEGKSASIVALATLTWMWRAFSVRKILEGVIDRDLNKRWHWIAIFTGYGVSISLNLLGYSFEYYTFPQALAVFVVVLDWLKSTKITLNHRPKISITHYLLLGTVLVNFAHMLDFPFFRFDPEFIILGFSISLMCNILMAILLSTVTTYELKMEYQRKLESKLELQSKFSALGEMTAGIAHEINNPLGLITTRANFLRNHILRNSAEKDFIVRNLDQIEETTQRMASIINSLRNFSRDNRKEPWKRISPGEIIDDTMTYCRDRFRLSSIQLIIDPYPEVTIVCRPIQVSQVLLNLMNNSFDAIVGSESPWVHLCFEMLDKTLRIKVIDSGNGIPESLRKKMMEPFFTTKEMGGTGIGLSISRGIVEDHRGKLYYDETSTNTTFVVELSLEDDLT